MYVCIEKLSYEGHKSQNLLYLMIPKLIQLLSKFNSSEFTLSHMDTINPIHHLLKYMLQMGIFLSEFCFSEQHHSIHMCRVILSRSSNGPEQLFDGEWERRRRAGWIAFGKYHTARANVFNTTVLPAMLYNEDSPRMTGVKDALTEMNINKKRWAGQVARMSENRWTCRLTQTRWHKPFVMLFDQRW
ncbi:unnamed protein product [Anisakis simplex]|uniref:Pentatricopeptide repeat-containing protein n=1 Tax=Anisakis simplex TaxID=6269 RepID=A0A0M3IZ01_ANISI|nr:unnamed protein product [Anisakis simplex]